MTDRATLLWTAWNNGKHHSSGAGYGFKVPIHDRDRHFDRDWKRVTLLLPFPSGPREAVVNVEKLSFWSDTCHELICKEIGLWLRERGLAPWPNGKPPKLEVAVLGSGRFEIKAALSS